MYQWLHLRYIKKIDEQVEATTMACLEQAVDNSNIVSCPYMLMLCNLHSDTSHT